METKKAIDNFAISGLKSDIDFIKSIILIKKAGATVNSELGLLDKKKAKRIISACDRLLNGEYRDQFVIDVYHSGAGTSLHMNVNEVIASLSGTHPNDDVNFSQSTNDVIPTALRITILSIVPKLNSALKNVIGSFKKKGQEFKTIIKPGKTHLRDAMPVTLGQEFRAYGEALLIDEKRLKNASEELKLLGIGGTAVGTGVNSHPKYRYLVIKILSELTGIRLKKTKNLQESMQNASDFLAVSSALRILAQNLVRIGNDLRLLSSGPGAGFNEISLPEVQKGSSIMPGKVNPSIIEALTMVCFQIIGFDQAIFLAGMSGQLELNVYTPLIAHNLINQIKMLTNSINLFDEKCMKGIRVNKKTIDYWLLKSTGSAAILNSKIGYEKSAELMKDAWESGKTVKDLAVEKGYLTKKEAGEIFNLRNLIKPNL